jgi:hypothetical protein
MVVEPVRSRDVTSFSIFVNGYSVHYSYMSRSIECVGENSHLTFTSLILQRELPTSIDDLDPLLLNVCHIGLNLLDVVPFLDRPKNPKDVCYAIATIEILRDIEHAFGLRGTAQRAEALDDCRLTIYPLLNTLTSCPRFRRNRTCVSDQALVRCQCKLCSLRRK